MWSRFRELLRRRDVALRELLATAVGNLKSSFDDLARRVDEIVERDRVTASEVDYMKAEFRQMRGQAAAQQADLEAFEALGEILESLGEDLQLEAALAVCAFPADRRLASAPGSVRALHHRDPHRAHAFRPRGVSRDDRAVHSRWVRTRSRR